MLQQEEKLGKQSSVGSQKKKMKQRNAKALSCSENPWGGGWRKLQLQVAAGTGCEETECGGAEPEQGENHPSGRPG